jgi:hypothetical protein
MFPALIDFAKGLSSGALQFVEIPSEFPHNQLRIFGQDSFKVRKSVT